MIGVRPMFQSLSRVISLNRSISNWIENRFPNFFDSPSCMLPFYEEVNAFLGDRTGAKVLEVGGIDRPVFPRRPSNLVTYDGLDIEHRPACGRIYDRFFVQSIEDSIPNRYDLIFSVTLLEHVSDNKNSLRSIFDALNEGGCSVHYVPSKYHPYSLILRCVGPRLQKILIAHFRPWAKDVTGYPAFFDLCSPAQLEQALGKIGYSSIRTIPFFRSNDYFRFFFPAFVFCTVWENLCRWFGFRELCSGFVVIAKRESSLLNNKGRI